MKTPPSLGKKKHVSSCVHYVVRPLTMRCGVYISKIYLSLVVRNVEKCGNIKCLMFTRPDFTTAFLENCPPAPFQPCTNNV